MRGTVTKVFPDRGFAFAEGPDKVSRFFHATWVDWGMFEMIEAGVTVDFTPSEGEKGPQAKEVHIVEVESA